MSGYYGQPLKVLAQGLDDLIWDEDLDDDKLQEASEDLLPALADALHERGSYNPELLCGRCSASRKSHPDRSFTLDKNEEAVAETQRTGRLDWKKWKHICNECAAGPVEGREK